MTRTIAGRNFPEQWFRLWMPWFDDIKKETFLKKLLTTGETELTKRHWGRLATKFCEDNAPKYYVMDMRGLFLCAGYIRYHLRDLLPKLNINLLYRGQSQDYRLIPSIYRRHKYRNDINSDLDHLELSLNDIAKVFDPNPKKFEEREGLAQHYGLRTRFLDAVDHLQTAAWFAYAEGRFAGNIDDAVGYIQLIAYDPFDQSFVEFIDLRKKPSEWLRPHIQQAYVVKRTIPHQHGDLYQFHVASFVVPRVLLRHWSGYDNITKEILMPNHLEDRGLDQSVSAARILIDKRRRINFRDPHIKEVMKSDALQRIRVANPNLPELEVPRLLSSEPDYLTYLAQCQMNL